MAVACQKSDESAESTPPDSPVAVPTQQAQPVALEDHDVTPHDHPELDNAGPKVLEGKELFMTVGCAGCHGETADGTDKAPNIAGRSAGEIQAQVRFPRDKMPPFSLDALSDENLFKIIEYVTFLEAPGSDGHDHVGDSKPELGSVVSQGITESGFGITISLQGRTDETGPVEGIVAQTVADLTVEFTDSSTGDPMMPDSRPSAWIDLISQGPNEGTDPNATCEANINQYAQGILGSQATIDLNSFYVLVMNDDSTISVIDPMKNVAGMTQLFSMVDLPGAAEDWALTRVGKELFVTIPDENQVVVADMDSFDVFRVMELDAQPQWIKLQPDEEYAWVGTDSGNGKSGVSVIDSVTLRVVTEFETGSGRHEIAFTDDSKFALVTNTSENTVSVINVRTLTHLTDLPTTQTPVAVAFSAELNLAYVAARTGEISIIRPDTPKVIGQMDSGVKIRDFQLSRDGRWGFVLEEGTSRILVLNGPARTETTSVNVVGDAYRMAVTDSYLYIHTRAGQYVSAVDLGDLENGMVPEVLEVVAAENTGGRFISASADSIAAVRGSGDEVVIASQAESVVHYYIGGMPSPMGSFNTHGKTPRAVLVVDKSMREAGIGLFQRQVYVPEPGEYRMALLVNSPRILYCFDFTANPNPTEDKNAQRAKAKLEILTTEWQASPNEGFSVQVRISDRGDGSPVLGVGDAQAIVMPLSGLWSDRYTMKSAGNGLYDAEIVLKQAGPYRLFFTIPSLQVSLDQSSTPTIMVEEMR